MTLVSKVRDWLRGNTEVVQPQDHDAVGPVLSQLYDDILLHRAELERDDRPEYKEFVSEASFTLHQVAQSDVDKRVALVLLAESLKK